MVTTVITASTSYTREVSQILCSRTYDAADARCWTQKRSEVHAPADVFPDILHPTRVQWAQKPFYPSPYYKPPDRNKLKEDETLYGGRQAIGTQNREEVLVVGTHRLLLQPVCSDPSTECSAVRKELSFRKKFPLPISPLNHVLHLFSILSPFFDVPFVSIDLIYILDVPFSLSLYSLIQTMFLVMV